MLNSPAPEGRRQAAARLVWSLLLSSSILYFFSTTEADNDLWGHIFFGRQIMAAHAIPRVDAYSYTATGLTWVDHEWLSQLLMATLYDTLGSAGLVLAKLLVAAGAFALVFTRLRYRTDDAAIQGITGLLTIAAMARGFAMRPQIITYLFLALLLLLLDASQRGRRGALMVVPTLFLPWANLHGGFALGLAILALFACADLPSAERSLRPWMVLIASAVLAAVNPYGPGLLLYVWNELSRAHPIGEWQRVTLSAEHLAFFSMLALLVVTLPFQRNGRRGWETLLALGAGMLALRHQRHTPVFAICAAAPLASQLEHARRWLRQRSSFVLGRASQRIIAATIVILTCVQLGLTALRCYRSGFQIMFEPLDYPVAAVRALQESGARLNLAVPLDWGEYVLWFLAPNIKVSLDGRFATVFPEQVVDDNFSFFSGAPGWQRLLEQYPTQAALVPAGPLCPLRSLPNWRLLYRDRVAELYVKADAAETVRVERSPSVPPTGVFP